MPENLTFSQAFEKARNSGRESFIYNGSRYTTQLQNETHEDWQKNIQKNHNATRIKMPNIEALGRQYALNSAMNRLQHLSNLRTNEINTIQDPLNNNYDILKSVKWKLFDPSQFSDPTHPNFDLKKATIYHITGRNPNITNYAGDPDIQKWQLIDDAIRREVSNYTKNSSTFAIPTIDNKTTWVQFGDKHYEIPLKVAVANKLNSSQIKEDGSVIRMHDRLKITPEQIKEWDPFGQWSEGYLNSGLLSKNYFKTNASDYRTDVASKLYNAYSNARMRGYQTAEMNRLQQETNNPLLSLRDIRHGDYSFGPDIVAAGNREAEATSEVIKDPDARAWLEINNSPLLSPADAKAQAINSTAKAYAIASGIGATLPFAIQGYGALNSLINRNVGKYLIRHGLPNLGKTLARYGVIDAPLDLYFMGDTIAEAAKGNEVSALDWGLGVGLPGAIMFRRPLLKGLKSLVKPSVYSPIIGAGLTGFGIKSLTSPEVSTQAWQNPSDSVMY